MPITIDAVLPKECSLIVQDVETAFGTFLVAASPRGICFIGRSIKGLKAHFPKISCTRGIVPDADRLLAPWARGATTASIARFNPDDFVLHFVGTEFQTRVWSALCDIPFGETRSYKDIALSIQSPRAVRAVGSANGANPLALVVPCHRVIAADGTIGGYAWGITLKECLLSHERMLAKAGDPITVPRQAFHPARPASDKARVAA